MTFERHDMDFFSFVSGWGVFQEKRVLFCC